MHLRHAWIALLSAAAGTLPAFAANDNSAAGPVVPLPEYHVTDYSSYLGFSWKAHVQNDKIKTLRFSRVEDNSLARNAGLLLDDRVVEIDSKPVSGMPVKDLQRAFFREWKPGDTLTWNLTVERGTLVAKRHAIALRLKTRSVEETAAAPEAAAE